MRGDVGDKLLRVERDAFTGKSGTGPAAILSSLPNVLTTSAIRLGLARLVAVSLGTTAGATEISAGGRASEIAPAVAGAAIASAVALAVGASSRTKPREASKRHVPKRDISSDGFVVKTWSP